MVPTQPALRTAMNPGRLRRLGGSPHLRSMGWGFLEYAFYPVAMLVATPLLIAELGQERYGLWMLVLALTSLGGLANVGMGSATIRFVSRFRGEGDSARTALAIRQTVTLALAGGLVMAVAVIAGADLLARHVFEKMGAPAEVALVLRLAAVVLLLQQVEVVLGAAIKGFERFDVAAPVEIGMKLSVIAAGVGAAYATGSVPVMVGCLVLVSAAGIAIRGGVASRLAGRGLLLPGWSPSLAREVFSFGGWTWLQGIAGSLFASADRIILGAALGAGSLAQYSVCTQLAQQIHAIPVAGMAFLFPLMSRRGTQASSEGRTRFIRKAIALNLALVLPLWALLAFAGKPILTLWVGPELADSSAMLLVVLATAYLVLAVNIAPHYLLLGSGHARFVSMVNVGGGLASVAAAAMLVPAWGVMGAAVSRMVYAPILFLGYPRIFRAPAAGTPP